MREYSEVREILCDLLSDSIKDGKIAIGDVEIIKNMLSGIEKTYKIEMFEEDGGYSRAGDWEADMRGTYARGSSYRGRKRDSMGRYSRDGRIGGYSRHDSKEAMMEQAREMMEDATNEREREAIRRFMTELERD
jgi:hypothetical protein|nr:MAG TPA: hypothetical protein [Caudoviricetes sp.]